MIGLFLATAFLLFGVSFYETTKLLLYWYAAWLLIFSIPIAVIVAAVGLVSAEATKEAAKGKIGGKILALAVGGTFSVLAAFLFLLRRICLVVGAYFWHLVATTPGASLESAVPILILGSVFVLIALIKIR